jgi:hypothetical protein
VLKGVEAIDRKTLRNDIVKLDKSFTPNFEKICGVTYRDHVTKEIIPIDIIDEGVVSACFTLLIMACTNTLNL